jgi:uncharacterized protein YndB with AHSA1/START domain
MLKIILLIVAVVIGVFLVVAMVQPDEFRVTRSTTIAAPAPNVFALVNELHNWEKWNPWQKVDPAMKVTFSGPPAGVGAGYEWVGNKDVGEGRLGIIESRPSDLVRLKLEFLKPFAATNTAEFTFKPEGNGTANNKTVVTWSMFGNKNFISKVMGLVMNMDKMVGGQFEKGLADMKATAEAGAK